MVDAPSKLTVNLLKAYSRARSRRHDGISYRQTDRQFPESDYSFLSLLSQIDSIPRLREKSHLPFTYLNFGI
jgi:hypothetical protein